jgi:hypothetical protein
MKKVQKKSVNKAPTKSLSFKLVEHKHTGKLIHHRHTSHIALVAMLLFVGILLGVSRNSSYAAQQSQTGSVTIGVTVFGPPPTEGATIITPVDGESFVDPTLIDVDGTCEADSYVVISNDGIMAGSTVCTSAGIFALQIQLPEGTHVLTALNYDNVNQPGPVTPAVRVTIVITPAAEEPPVSELPTPAETVDPVVPLNPTIIPGVTPEQAPSAPNAPIVTDPSCKTFAAQPAAASKEPRVAVVCMPRIIKPNTTLTIGVFVWGGTPPYALSMESDGNSKDALRSLNSGGYITIDTMFKKAGSYTLKFNLRDSRQQSAYVEVGLVVEGEVPPSFIGGITNDILRKSWFETPVPLYIVAVIVVLGFWAGDIFDRRFGAKPSGRARKLA